MALPTSSNNVTVRKLASTLDSYNTKVNTKLGGKADKVSGATNGHFAGLDANGNLTDSGKSSSDFVAKSAGVTNVSYDTTNKKITKTINGTTTDVVSASTLKTDMGLGNVTNDAQVKRSEMGVANGVATLDTNGKIPTSQIPGAYDDVKEGYLYNGAFYEDSSHTIEIPAAADKVYVDIPNNTTYRWSGTQYVKIGSDLALGETSSTAYRGDRGKVAYDFSQNPYTSNPAMNGTASAGSSTKWSRGDHVHPTDTSREAVSNKKTSWSSTLSDTNYPSEKLVKSSLDNKVDKVSGKGLSTNDFTTTLKNKLDGIAAGAEVNVQSDWGQSDDTADDYIKNKPDLGGAALMDVVTEWSSTTSDENIPSEKLVKSSLDNKVDKVNGKGLSTNDFTTTLKNKLDGITAGATKIESSTTNGNIKINGTETTVYTHPSTTATAAAAKKIGKDALGHVVIGDSLTKSDVGLGNVDNTSDETKKSNFTGSVASGNTGFPTGGDVYTAISNATTSVTNEWLGQGYASSTSNSSAAFTASITNYLLKKGGIVAIKFSAAVPASATLNINSKGAKNIYYGGSAIGANVIQSGDTAVFMYDGTQYKLLCVDRSAAEMTDTEVTDLVNALT